MVGLTLCVPPVACRVYVLPLLPVTVTCAAFAAVTVRVDELPEVIVPGLAAMVTVGAVALELFVKLAPQPANSRDQQRQKNASIAEREERQVAPSRGVSFEFVSRTRSAQCRRTADPSAHVKEEWREPRESRATVTFIKARSFQATASEVTLKCWATAVAVIIRASICGERVTPDMRIRESNRISIVRCGLEALSSHGGISAVPGEH